MNKLDQFEALEKAATAGPWKHKHHGELHDSEGLLISGYNDSACEGFFAAEGDAVFTAAARNIAPHLIRLARVADDCADKLALLRDLSDTEAYVSRALNAALAPLLAEVCE